MKQERLVGRHRRSCRTRTGAVTTLIRPGHHFSLRRVLRARNVFRAFAPTRLSSAGRCCWTVCGVRAIRINKSGEDPLVPRILSATKLPARLLSGSSIMPRVSQNQIATFNASRKVYILSMNKVCSQLPPFLHSRFFDKYNHGEI